MRRFTAARTAATRRTSSGCSSIRRSTRWAWPGRPEHLLRATAIPLRAHRPRRPDHLPRPGPGRRLPAARPARGASSTVRDLVRAARAGGDRPARGARRAGAGAARRARASTSTAPRSPRSDCACAHGCCYHGLALNVDMDLAPFAAIDPCGYPGLAVTQHARSRHRAPAPTNSGERLARRPARAQLRTASHERRSTSRPARPRPRASRSRSCRRSALKKPDWIRVKAGNRGTRFYEIKRILREHKLHTVCEEASCPNIGECFGKGTATFMILGDLCTRRCPFCDVAHGRPLPPDADEPRQSRARPSPR